MEADNPQNNNNESQDIVNNNTEAIICDKKLNISRIAKAKLLRQKLREKKNKQEAEKNSNLNENEELPNSIEFNNLSNSSSNNIYGIYNEEVERKEKDKDKEKIDPLKFVFSSPSENRKDDENNPLSYLNLEINEDKEDMQIQEVNEESSEMPKIIILEASNTKEEDSNKNKFETPYQKNNKITSPTKKYRFSKFIKKTDTDSDSSSSNEEEFEKDQMQRLINIKNAQQNLFKKNKTAPKETISPSNKNQIELTKEDILQKLFLDFDNTSELLELNEKKKQIMLKKMRKTIRRLSNLRLRSVNQEEDEKRNLINKKIEELKNITGDNYKNIKQNVDKIILDLRMPDYYFCDDEDVEIISERTINIKSNIKPIFDIDFSSFIRQ